MLKMEIKVQVVEQSYSIYSYAPKFDQHANYHRSTCFKKSNKSRANLPILVCNMSYLLDDKYILKIRKFLCHSYIRRQQDKDLQAMREVDLFQLNSKCSVSTRSQFLLITKQEQACQYFNQYTGYQSLRSYHATPTLQLVILPNFTTTYFTK